MESNSLVPVFMLCAFSIILAFMLSAAIRIVPEYARAVIFRLGRFVGVRGPGLVFVLPTVDRAILVDLREQTRSLTSQRAITADNVPLKADLTWTYKITDPARSVLEAANPDKTLQEVAKQAWDSLIESQSFDQIVSNRPHLRAMIRQQLEDATQKWGIEITGVQLSEITKG